MSFKRYAGLFDLGSTFHLFAESVGFCSGCPSHQYFVNHDRNAVGVDDRGHCSGGGVVGFLEKGGVRDAGAVQEVRVCVVGLGLEF